MHIEYLDYLSKEFKTQAVKILWPALKYDFDAIFGQGEKAERIIAESLDPKQCLVAIQNRQLIGILALQTQKHPCLQPTLQQMTTTYGLFNGIYRKMVMSLVTHHPKSDELYVYGVATAKSVRGKGVGTQLFAQVGQLALRQGFKIISLYVISTNPRAEALYSRLGFKVEKRTNIKPVNKFFGWPFDSVIFMTKKVG